MNDMKQKFADKKYMAEHYRADMSYGDFRIAVAARGQMLADIAVGKSMAYEGVKKPSRAEVRQRWGKK